MFVSTAWAADLNGEMAEPSFLVSIMPLILVFIIFYFMILRPQNKRIASHRNMVNTLRRGDRVVTGGGIVAVVKKLIGEDEVLLEVADGVQITAVRSTLMTVRDARPANDSVGETHPVKKPAKASKPKSKAKTKK